MSPHTTNGLTAYGDYHCKHVQGLPRPCHTDATCNIPICGNMALFFTNCSFHDPLSLSGSFGFQCRSCLYWLPVGALCPYYCLSVNVLPLPLVIPLSSFVSHLVRSHRSPPSDVYVFALGRCEACQQVDRRSMIEHPYLHYKAPAT